MSVILDALRRVEEQLRKSAGQKTADGLASGPDASSARDDSPIQPKEAAPGENDEVMRVYLSLVDMIARIEDRVQAAAEEERAETRGTVAELGQAMAALQDEIARQREALQEETQQRDTEREAGKVALEVVQSQIYSPRQILAENREAVAKLTQAIVALQDDIARQRETLQEETRQRNAEREAGKAALAAAHSQSDSVKQTLAEAGEAIVSLAQTMAALQNDFAHQREALQEETRQRDAEREAGKTALAAAHSHSDSVRQTLAEAGEAIANLTQAMAALQSDLAHQREAFQEEIRQRNAQRGAGNAAMAAAQSQADSPRETPSEIRAVIAELAQAVVALQSDLAHQREAFQEEIRQRNADREAGNAAMAAAQSQSDSVRQTLADAGESIANLAQAMVALQSDLARQREASQEEIRQRNADRQAGNAALAAAQSQSDSVRQALAEAREATASLAQTMTALQSDFARQRETLQEESRQRDAEREAGNAALAAVQSQSDSVRQTLAEVVESVANLAQAMVALQNDFAHQRETLQEEIRQRHAERDAEEVKQAAAHSDSDAVKQTLAEAGEAIATMAQTVAALQSHAARQRETLQEEIRQRHAEREAENAALAAAQSQIDSLRQLLVEHEAAEGAQFGTPLAAGLDVSAPAQDGREGTAGESIREEPEPRPVMDKYEAQRLHSAAGEAYARRDFAEALRLLDIIDAAFPYNKSILYNRAECLIHLGRNNEARRLCDYLATTLNHAPAKELKSKIKD